MSKPKFRLATLLKLREQVREERRGELAKAYRADEVLTDALDEVETERLGNEEAARRAGGAGTLDVDRLTQCQRYEWTLRARRSELEGQRKILAEEIERRRAALVKANSDVRVLEKLEEKQAEQQRAAEEAHAMKELDEAAGRMARLGGG